MANKKDWRSTAEYQRLMEFLEEQWLSQPDVARVDISVTATNADGDRVTRYIDWRNPDKEETIPF